MLLNQSTYNSESLSNFYVKFVADTLVYIRNFALYISLWIVGYLVVCCVVYRRYARRLPTRTRGALRAKRVLVVVAHPDDECMFFGPTIFRLCEQGADVHLLCLSNGMFCKYFIIRALNMPWTLAFLLHYSLKKTGSCFGILFQTCSAYCIKI